jgi:secondary thiamine-phosphate synthase enzyme
MKVFQTSLNLKPYKRGFHLITSQIESVLQNFKVTTGTINIFIQHTSASLTINENVDPSVRDDMENFFSDNVDRKSYYTHTYEGTDDMPAHIKSSLLGQSLTIPITDTKLNLGTWQGIYLGEHRDYANSRVLIITIIGE